MKNRAVLSVICLLLGLLLGIGARLPASWSSDEVEQYAQITEDQRSIGVKGMVVFRITGVGIGGPGDLAELKSNDLVYMIDNRQIYHVDDFLTPIAHGPAGKTFELKYFRFNPQTEKFDPGRTKVTSEMFKHYEYRDQ